MPMTWVTIALQEGRDPSARRFTVHERFPMNGSLLQITIPASSVTPVTGASASLLGVFTVRNPGCEGAG